MPKLSFLFLVLGFILISPNLFAAIDPEVSYILNTLLFLIGGFLVMWMAAGFAMLESGLVTSKSVSTIAAKNIGVSVEKACTSLAEFKSVKRRL